MRRQKYGAIPTTVDGIRFHSQGEAMRYGELKLAERSGTISDLRLQPKFKLVVKDVKVGDYVADFQYIERGNVIVEDYKGVRTPVYKLKKKLMQAIYGIEIFETGADQ